MSYVDNPPPPVHPDADGDRCELRDGGVLLGEARRARDLALPPLHLHHQHGHLRRLLHHHEDLPEVITDRTVADTSGKVARIIVPPRART